MYNISTIRLMRVGHRARLDLIVVRRSLERVCQIIYLYRQDNITFNYSPISTTYTIWLFRIFTDDTTFFGTVSGPGLTDQHLVFVH